jgi:PEP-CTERM motif
MKPTNTQKLICSSAVVLLVCRVASAQLYLEDGFNYTSGQPLAGSGSWLAASGTAPVINIGSGSLSYNGLSDTSPSGYEATTVQTAGTSNDYSPLNSDATSGTVYMSFLAQCTVIPGTTGYYLAGMLPSTTTVAGGRTTDPLAIYVKGVSGLYQIGIGTYGGGSTVYDPNATGLSPGSAVNLIVVSYDLSTGLASMWFNPTSLGGSAPTADITDQGTAGEFSDIDYTYLKDLSTYGDWNIDTLRIGGTWADVTPVPEPSVLALAALGGLSLLSFRRRN